jgi:8-oxo-dGTP pyrophosphatase MutT (NUDIX family)
MTKPILTGAWNDNISWEFYLTAELPDPELCATVYCLAILPDHNQIVLTRNHRGIEMLGGHVEVGESIEQAVLRECLEEGGFQVDNYRLFGVQKLRVTQRVPHPTKGRHYPFPLAYVPYFVATSRQPLQKPTGEEIIEACVFGFDQVDTITTDHQQLISVGLESYTTYASL